MEESNQELMNVVIGLMQRTDQMIKTMGTYHTQLRSILAIVGSPSEKGAEVASLQKGAYLGSKVPRSLLGPDS